MSVIPAVYLDYVITEVLLDPGNDIWTDISQYIVSDIEGEYGLPGPSPIDRTATTGYIKFSLNNEANLFTPQLTTTLGGKDGGFAKGTKIRMTPSFEGDQWRKFYGTIDQIEIDSRDYGARQVIVTAVDWMNSAATFPIRQAVILENISMDEAIQTIVALMPTAPLTSTYSAGMDEFPTVFDSTSLKTKAITEFQKLAMSELSYVYLRRDRVTGERLIVESRASRNTSVLQKIPVIRSLAGKQLLMDGAHRLLMDGSYKLLHQTNNFIFDNNMLDLKVVNGDNVINDVTVRVYPRKIAAGLTVLFTLQTAQIIPAGETTTLRGGYKDAYGKTCNGTGFTDVATNVSYTLSSGTITITGAEFGSEAFLLPIHNAGAQLTLLTLTVSGKELHLDEPIESTISDEVSIAQNDYRSVDLDQPYQDDLQAGITLAYITIFRGAKPNTLGRRISLLANQDISSMIAFLCLDIGALVAVRETRSEINASYYIVHIGFSISPGGIVNFWFDIQDARSYSPYFWQVGTAGRTEVGNLIVGV